MCYNTFRTEFGSKKMTTLYINTKIEALTMSVRLRNCLKREGIDTVGSLLDFPSDGWSGVSNIGAKTLDEVTTLIAAIKDAMSELCR